MSPPAFQGHYYIGNSGEYFPYCYRNRFTNNLEGIYLFVWQIIAKQTGAKFTPKFYTYDSTDSIANLTFDGLQGAVLRGNLLTAFEGTSMAPGMPFLYRYTMPFFESSVSQYETRRTTLSGQPANYILYPQDLLLLFVAILFFTSVVDSARHVVSSMMGWPDDGRSYQFTFLIPSITLVLALKYDGRTYQFTFLIPSIMLVLAIHNAGYSGNSLSRPPEATTYDKLMTTMMGGTRQFVLEPKYLITYKADFDHFMGPASKPFNIAQFELLCTDPTLVSAIFTLDLATVAAIKGRCTLVRIPTPGYIAGLQNFDDSRYYGMIFGKNYSTNKMVEYTNQVLLRYFREEQMFNMWIPRFAKTYVGNIWGDTTNKKMEDQYASYRFENLNGLMPIIYAFYGACILIFIIEVVGYHSGFAVVRRWLAKITAAFQYIKCMGVK